MNDVNKKFGVLDSLLNLLTQNVQKKVDSF